MVRMKHRYLGVYVTAKYCKDQFKSVKPNELLNAISQSLKELYGQYQLASVIPRLRVKDCNTFIRTAIVRCDHKHFDHVASTLPFITQVGDVPCKVRTVVVSGTIINCKQYLNAYILKIICKEGIIPPLSERI